MFINTDMKNKAYLDRRNFLKLAGFTGTLGLAAGVFKTVAGLHPYRSSGYYLRGTAEKGNWSLEPDGQESERILKFYVKGKSNKIIYSMLMIKQTPVKLSFLHGKHNPTLRIRYIHELSSLR
jgi:hypothetical protein